MCGALGGGQGPFSRAHGVTWLQQRQYLMKPSPLGGFSWCLSSKELACNAGETGDVGSNPGLGRSPRGRKWQPTSVFLPGKSHGQRRLMGYSLWGHRASDTTEHAHRHLTGGGKHGERGREEEPGACEERQRSGRRRGHATQPQAAPLGPQGTSSWGWGWGRHPDGTVKAPSSPEPGRLDTEAV